MRKTLAVLASIAVVGAAASTASAKPGQFNQFGEVTAFNGAHLYARMHFDGVPNDKKTIVDCLATHTGVNHRSAKWLCVVDTYNGVDTPADHALIGVLRKHGEYVFRTYQLVRE